MKSSIAFNPQLLAFLQSRKSWHKADLFAITLPNGQVITATDGQLDIIGVNDPLPASRLQSSGGSTTTKYLLAIVSPSANGVLYQLTVKVKNQGANFVIISANLGSTVTINPGEIKNVVISTTGDGATNLQFTFISQNSGDALDLIVSNPIVAKVSDGINLIPSPKRDFTSWTASGGATITITTGATFGQVTPALFPANFYATKFGQWQRGKITSQAMFQLSSGQMDLSVIADQTVLYPGTSLPLLQAVVNGLFDGAQVWVYTLYMPLGSYGDTGLGLEVKFCGDITHVTELTRTMATFNVQDLLYRLNINTPPNLVQSPCRFTLFDSGCTLSRATFTDNITAAAGTTNLVIQTSGSLPHASPYYDQGLVVATSGPNSGLTQIVKSQPATNKLQLSVPFIFPLAIGDTFAVSAGCDKLPGTCQFKFANLINYGGMPYTPIPETTI